MAGRKIKSVEVDAVEEADKAADEVIAAGETPTQIAKIRFAGLSGDAPRSGSVTDYLDHYTKRDVEFWNPLTQMMETRPAAEVIALQMVIAALHGDKSATNRLIERTEGKVSVSTPTPAKVTEVANTRTLAEQVEKDRQQELRTARNDREKSLGAVARIMCEPPNGMNAGLIGHNSNAANDLIDVSVPDDAKIM